jgi:hypothetical protein
VGELNQLAQICEYTRLSCTPDNLESRSVALRQRLEIFLSAWKSSNWNSHEPASPVCFAGTHFTVWVNKLEITPPSNSYHLRYGTRILGCLSEQTLSNEKI